MEDFSEQAIKEKCPHCDTTSQAFKYTLEQTDNFFVVCDANSIVEGHILIIPKEHVSCIAEYSDELFKEFLELNNKVSKFLLDEYGSVSSFEHGIFGQTVFHSHIHYLPFKGKETDIVSEANKLEKINDLTELKNLFKKDNGYLFFSIGDDLFSVNVDIAAPRFFRDRFAIALGRPERGSWKEMRANPELSKKAEKDCLNAQEKWKTYSAATP